MLLQRARRGDGARTRGETLAESSAVVLKVRLPSGKRVTLSGLRAADVVAEVFVRVADLLAEAEEVGGGASRSSSASASSSRAVRLGSLEILTQCVHVRTVVARV